MLCTRRARESMAGRPGPDAGRYFGPEREMPAHGGTQAGRGNAAVPGTVPPPGDRADYF